MGKLKFLILIFSLCIVGCSTDSENEEPNELYMLHEIIGKWTTSSYHTSGGYFTPNNDGEFFDFKTDNTCVYYSGNTLNTYDYYEFVYSVPQKNIVCKHSKGWDLNIKVEFSNENEAIFYIDGKTSNSSKTIKVKRN